MWKQFAKFVEFSVDEMHHISQQLKEWLRNLRKQVWLWTINYPHIIVPAGHSTTLPQWTKVLLRVQEHRLASVHNNWAFREAPCSEFPWKNGICMLKVQLTQEFKPTDHVQRENLLIGFWKTKKWTAVFRRKSSLVMRSTFSLMSTWNHKTVGFGAWRILEWCMKSHCMHSKPLFGADFGLVEWLGRTFSKRRLEMQ